MMRWRQNGVSLIELVCVSAIVLALASIAIPVGHTMVKRQKEIELRRALRDIRQAIDKFQADAMAYRQVFWGPGGPLNTTNEEGYPEDLMTLVEGVELEPEVRIKYLRRIPRDPITGTDEWGTRSSRDTPGSLFSDGINIFDVHSKSDAVALDGTHYNEW